MKNQNQTGLSCEDCIWGDKCCEECICEDFSPDESKIDDIIENMRNLIRDNYIDPPPLCYFKPSKYIIEDAKKGELPYVESILQVWEILSLCLDAYVNYKDGVYYITL